MSTEIVSQQLKNDVMPKLVLKAAQEHHESVEEKQLMQLSFDEYTKLLKPIVDMRPISAMKEEDIDAIIKAIELVVAQAKQLNVHIT